MRTKSYNPLLYYKDKKKKWNLWSAIACAGLILLYPLLHLSYAIDIGKFIEFCRHPAQSITDEILQGLFGAVISIITSLLTKLVSATVDPFGPSTTKFVSMLGSEDMAKMFEKTAVAFGAALATVLFLIGLLTFFWNSKDARDTPFQLFARYVIAMFFIYESTNIVQIFLDVADTVWSICISLGTDRSLKFEDFVCGTYAETAKSATILGVTIANPGLNPFGVIISFVILAMTWALLKGYLRLYIEIVERYIVVMLMYYFFAAAAATVVSKNSVSILKSYFRMLGAQLFLLMTNLLFVRVFVSLLVAGTFTKSLPNFVFGLAFLRTCQRIDSYMASMGINVAQTGSSLADTMLGSGRMILGGLRAANQARYNAGAMIRDAGIASGNPGLMSAGATIATGFGRGAQQSPVDTLNVGKDATKRKIYAEGGQKNPGSWGADAQTGSKLWKDYLNNNTSSDARNAVNFMNDKSKLEGAQEMLREAGEKNLVLDSIDESGIGSGKGLAFKGHLEDDQGNIVGEAGEVTGVLSGTDKDGSTLLNNGIHMTTASNLEQGTTLKRDDASGMTIDNMAKATGINGLLNNDKSGQALKGQIDSITMQGRGNMVLKNKNNEQIGLVSTNGKGAQRLYQSADLASAASGIKPDSKSNSPVTSLPIMSSKDAKKALESTGLQLLNKPTEHAKGVWVAQGKLNGESAIRRVAFKDLASAGSAMPTDAKNYKMPTFGGKGYVGISIENKPITASNMAGKLTVNEGAGNGSGGAQPNKEPVSTPMPQSVPAKPQSTPAPDTAPLTTPSSPIPGGGEDFVPDMPERTPNGTLPSGTLSEEYADDTMHGGKTIETIPSDFDEAYLHSIETESEKYGNSDAYETGFEENDDDGGNSKYSTITEEPSAEEMEVAESSAYEDDFEYEDEFAGDGIPDDDGSYLDGDDGYPGDMEPDINHYPDMPVDEKPDAPVD